MVVGEEKEDIAFGWHRKDLCSGKSPEIACRTNRPLLFAAGSGIASSGSALADEAENNRVAKIYRIRVVAIRVEDTASGWAFMYSCTAAVFSPLRVFFAISISPILGYDWMRNYYPQKWRNNRQGNAKAPI